MSASETIDVVVPATPAPTKADLRRQARDRRLMVRLEKRGLPVTVPAISEVEGWSSPRLRALQTYSDLSAARRRWVDQAGRRLMRYWFGLSAANVALVFYGLRWENVPVWFSLLELAVSVTSAFFVVRGLQAMTWGQTLERDALGFLERHRPDVVWYAESYEKINPNWTIHPDGAARALAGIVAAGGEAALPSAWVYETDPRDYARAMGEGFDTPGWIARQNFSPVELETFEALAPAYVGSLGELARTVRALG